MEKSSFPIHKERRQHLSRKNLLGFKGGKPLAIATSKEWVRKSHRGTQRFLCLQEEKFSKALEGHLGRREGLCLCSTRRGPASPLRKREVDGSPSNGGRARGCQDHAKGHPGEGKGPIGKNRERAAQECGMLSRGFRSRGLENPREKSFTSK